MGIYGYWNISSRPLLVLSPTTMRAANFTPTLGILEYLKMLFAFGLALSAYNPWVFLGISTIHNRVHIQ